MTDGWLTGWKAISHYLGVCERSAMRYWQNYGLPAKRMPSGKITATRNDLDKWRAKSDEKMRGLLPLL